MQESNERDAPAEFNRVKALMLSIPSVSEWLVGFFVANKEKNKKL